MKERGGEQKAGDVLPRLVKAGSGLHALVCADAVEEGQGIRARRDQLFLQGTQLDRPVLAKSAHETLVVERTAHEFACARMSGARRAAQTYVRA